MKELREMKLHFKKTVEKEFFFEKKVWRGEGRAREKEEEQTEQGVCETGLCNCSDIFIESPPSLSCVLRRASLMPVDWGEQPRRRV